VSRQPSAGSTKLATALRDYREALAHQSATAEVLKIIGAGQGGPQEVFDAIVQRAARLFAPCNVGLAMLEDGWLHLRAMAGPRIAELDREEIASVYPLPNDPANVLTARVVAEGRTLEIPDSAAPGLPALFVRAARVGKFRSAVFVPFGRGGKGVGALVLNHPRPGFRLKPRQLALFETFADQALIAIENARLLAEIREKTRALEVAGRHKSEFLANMSHELRTPLNAVIGFAEALRAKLVGEVNPKQAEYLGNIREAGEHLLALINDVLDLSKVEAGHMELALSRFDLPGVIAQAMTQVRPRALREEIELVKTLDPGVGEIEADERKLKQVLLNLLSNAVKFTPRGGRVEVLASRREAFFEIAVKDSGVGISSEDQSRLFETFRQVGREKREGTGLGLALSKRFVELHGGTLAVESRPGAGSTFTVKIPQSK
jgi:signal transduction histidine kinase